MRKSHPSKGVLMTLLFLFRLVRRDAAKLQQRLLCWESGMDRVFFCGSTDQQKVQRNTEIHQTYNK